MDTISGATQLGVRLTKKEQYLQDERKSAGWVPWPPSPPDRELLGQASEDVARIWIELYAHDLQYTLDGPPLPRPTSFRAPHRHQKFARPNVLLDGS